MSARRKAQDAPPKGYRHARARCPCMNGADAPSTHRGALHWSPDCPHSSLYVESVQYPTRHASLRKQREIARKRTPAHTLRHRVARVYDLTGDG